MNENFNQMYEEKVISLISCCFYVLRKWRMMIVIALIAAIAVSGMTYVKSYKNYENSKNMPATEKTEQVALTEEEREYVEAKLEVIEENRANIAEYDYYMENSIKANLDSNGFYQGVIRYVFSADSNNTMIKALSLCTSEAFSEEKYEILSEKLSNAPDTALLREVISREENWRTADMSTDTEGKYEVDVEYTVIVNHYTLDDCEKMTQFFEEELEKVPELLENQGIIVKMEKASAGVQATSDKSLVTWSRDIVKAKLSAFDAIEDIKSKMTEEQLEYYELLCNSDLESTEDKGESTAGTSVAKPSVNIKLAVVAAFIGAFLVAVFYCLIYLLGGRVHSNEELKSWLNVPVFGMKNTEAGGGRKSKIDALLDSFEKGIDNAVQDTPEMIAALLANAVEQNDARKLYLTSSVAVPDEKVIAKLKELLSTANVELTVGASILKDSKALQEAIECDSIVFFEKCDKTMEKDVREEIHKASACGIKVLSIILEK